MSDNVNKPLMRQFKLKIDDCFSLDENLQVLYEQITEDNLIDIR